MVVFYKESHKKMINFFANFFLIPDVNLMPLQSERQCLGLTVTGTYGEFPQIKNDPFLSRLAEQSDVHI